MPSSTVKARKRAIERTLDAAERLADGPLPHLDSKEQAAGPKCLECGTVTRKDCCWYSQGLQVSAEGLMP
jgi:hypothetical protein